MKKNNEKRNLVGPRIMEERKRQGLTRAELLSKAETFGVRMSPRTLSLIERQKRPLYDKEFYALFKALDMPLDILTSLKN